MRVGGPDDEISAFIRKDTKEFALSPLSMWGHSEKVVFYKPEKYTAPEPDHTGTLISDFYPPEP